MHQAIRSARTTKLKRFRKSVNEAPKPPPLCTFLLLLKENAAHCSLIET